MGFPCSSDGKKSVCNAGEPGSVPRSERSPREGNGYPLQYSCLENSVDRPWGHEESDTTEWLMLSLWRQGVIIWVSPSADSLSIFCRGQVWNKSPNMFQTCLVIKLLDVHHCFGRKLRPRDVKGWRTAELEWRRWSRGQLRPWVLSTTAGTRVQSSDCWTRVL